MENASKALIIAGSILIALITISLFYFVFGKMGTVVDETSENTYQKQLIAFNSSFEAYNKKTMYGMDVISVLNKAIDNNKNYSIDEGSGHIKNGNMDYFVNIIFTTKDGTTYNLKENYSSTITFKEKIEKATKEDRNQDEFDEYRLFMFGKYQCTKVSYVPKTTNKNREDAVGRVCEMVFAPQ